MNDDIESVAPAWASRKAKMHSFTPEEEKRLLETYSYDPDTGKFTWKKDSGRWGKMKAGTKAGHLLGNGRWGLAFEGRQLQAHRVAFLIMTGRWPVIFLDHKDTNPLNNRWSNIREATPAQNQANQNRTITNTSGFKGVFFDSRRKSKKRWRTHIRYRGRRYGLGSYLTPEEAWEAYCSAAFFAFGEFANVGY